MIFGTFYQYYCYKKDCPVRTEKEPWPFGMLSEKKKEKCPHCKTQMTKVSTGDDFR